mgnify:CR=1 FL=1
MREAAAAFGEAAFTEADLNLPLYNGDDEDAESECGDEEGAEAALLEQSQIQHRLAALRQP